MQHITYQQALQLMELRIIIARAGQNDCLRWWEDESLTPNGVYLLERIFPGAPAISGRNLALSASAARHHAALEHLGDVTHLFRISRINADQLAMRDLRYHIFERVSHSIADLNALRQILLEIIGTEPKFEVIGTLSQNGGLQIRLSEPTLDVGERANALAWAYLESKPGQPVFPYIMEQ